MTARFATSADDDLLVSVVTHPEVWRHTACDDAVPFTPLDYTTHPRSFAVVVDGGCFLAAALEQSAYAVHTNFLPAARGKHAIRECREALALAFLATDAEVLYTMVPDSNPQALWLAHLMGFKNTFRRASCWPVAGVKRDVQHLRMDIDDWIIASPECAAVGHEFHVRLDGVAHDDDPTHDAFVGAAQEMIAYGQVDKAQRIYGRWARSAGYQPFEIVSRDPLVIHIGTHRLHVANNDFMAERI